MFKPITIPEPTEIVQNTLVIYDNVLSPEQCEDILNTINDNYKFVKSTTYWDNFNDKQKSEYKGTKDYTDYRISDQVFISGEKSLKPLDSFLFQVFNAGVASYIDLMMKTGTGDNMESNSSLIISDDEGYVLLKYTPGGKYDIHYDQAVHENKIKPIRIISSLLYLNGDFEGGETYFRYQDYKVKPKPGRLVFFPSGYTHPHASIPVTEGTKYAIVTWFR